MSYPSNTDSVAQDQIKAFVDRILRMKEEAKAIGDDIREIYAEAKANGFDKTQLGKLVSYVEKKAKDPHALAEADALFDVYLSAYYGLSHTHAYAREETPVRHGGEKPVEREPGTHGGDHDNSAVKDGAPIHSSGERELSVSTPAATGIELGDSAPSVERTPEPSNVTPIRKQWKHSDPAHPDCRNPGQCGGFSNSALCRPCAEAAEAGQVA